MMINDFYNDDISGGKGHGSNIEAWMALADVLTVVSALVVK